MIPDEAYIEAKTDRTMELLGYVLEHGLADETARRHIVDECEEIGSPDLGDGCSLLVCIAAATAHFVRKLNGLDPDQEALFGLADLSPAGTVTPQIRGAQVAAQMIVRCANGDRRFAADLAAAELMNNPESSAVVLITLLQAFHTTATATLHGEQS